MTRLLYELFTPLLVSQASLDEGQGGHRSKAECSLLLVLAAKWPFHMENLLSLDDAAA